MKSCCDCIRDSYCASCGLTAENPEKCLGFYPKNSESASLPRTCSNGYGVIVRPDGVHELSPHAYKLTQRLRNVTVEVLTCETCGDVSVAWYRQEDTEDITNDG